MTQTEYILGHSKREIERLAIQSALLQPTTLRLFREAGLAPGMSVLDIGCGTGDMAILAATIVGPSGSVVGIDRNADAIAYARTRSSAADLPIKFHDEALTTSLGFGQFDFVISRWVIMYQPDPAHFLRTAASYIKPGGILAFQEPARGAGLFGNLQLWNSTLALLYQAFKSTSPEADPTEAIFAMPAHFKAAGLGQPNMFGEISVGEGPGCPFYSWAAETMRSLLPQLEKVGVVTASDINVDSLEDRLRQEAVEAGELLTFVPQFCGWLQLTQI